MLRLREGGVVRCGEWTEGGLSALSPALSALSPSSAASVKHASTPFPGASGELRELAEFGRVLLARELVGIRECKPESEGAWCGGLLRTGGKEEEQPHAAEARSACGDAFCTADSYARMSSSASSQTQYRKRRVQAS